MRKSIGKKLRFDVLHRDAFTCQYCGARPPDVVLHLDHRIPVAAGGQNTFDNLLTSCAPCNIGKGVTLVSVSAGVSRKAGKPGPRLEIFWDAEARRIEDEELPLRRGQSINRTVSYITAARIAEFPKSFDDPFERDTEYFRLCNSREPHFSTFGASSRESNHAIATKIFDLLGSQWLRSRDFAAFLDDVLMFTEAGQLPTYIAPMVLRSTHPEVLYSRCLIRDADYEDIGDAIFAQCKAVFSQWLANETSTPTPNAGRVG